MSDHVTRNPPAKPDPGPPSLARRIIATGQNVWWQGFAFGLVVGFGGGVIVMLCIVVAFRKAWIGG